ncbi:hypothetical protein TNCV_417621 [Trichonephila clavipes]|nr:hypothetical protein TNCV_417621 [Trichonephila clavipes]
MEYRLSEYSPKRGKWMIEKDNVMCGTMVIVKEDFTPVCNWLLGRVVKVYHGSDGKKRDSSVNTMSFHFVVHRTIGDANTCNFQSRINEEMDALRTFYFAANGFKCYERAPNDA